MQDNNVFKDWLSRRKISDSVLSEFNVHSGSNPTFGECIVIPVFDETGNFIFNKYRRNPLQVDIKPKYLYDRGSKSSLYGLHKAIEHKTILITEGEMDCLVAWSHNIPAVSGTGGANTFLDEWGKYFIDKEVILCFDNDLAGGEGMVNALRVVPHAKIVFIPDRAGVKDISDYVQNGGDLNALLKTAISLNTIEKVLEDRANRQSVWLSTYYHEAFIKEHTKIIFEPRKRDKTITDKVLRAKDYPIDNLLDFVQNKAICPFHNEKSPSLHYYRKTNTCYCFGSCGKPYDSIDIYRKLYDCSFKQAIEKLQ